jgi:hypothetical protein
LVNNGPAGFGNGPNYIYLDGDASVGGTNRWDIRGSSAFRFALNGFTLTKTGPGGIYVVEGAVSNGTVNIAQGQFGFHTAAADFTNGQINVQSGGDLNFYSSADVRTPISIFGGRLSSGAGGNSTIYPLISLSNAPATFVPDGGDNLIMTNLVTGTAGLVVDGTTGGGVEFEKNNSFIGNLVISNGYVTLGRGGLEGSVTSTNITMFNGATLYLWRTNALTLTNAISGNGTFIVRTPSGLVISNGRSIRDRPERLRRPQRRLLAAADRNRRGDRGQRAVPDGRQRRGPQGRSHPARRHHHRLQRGAHGSLAQHGRHLRHGRRYV